jgi:hypothetical protein
MKVYNAIVFALGLAFCAALALYPKTAPAQHNHPDGHSEYENWQSGVTDNCCNNKDCGFLKDDEVRETPQGTEVFVHVPDQEPKWCPVQRLHYITRGKSPDWNRAHACIIQSGSYADECQRLLCFSGKGLW